MSQQDPLSDVINEFIENRETPVNTTYYDGSYVQYNTYDGHMNVSRMSFDDFEALLADIELDAAGRMGNAGALMNTWRMVVTYQTTDHPTPYSVSSPFMLTLRGALTRVTELMNGKVMQYLNGEYAILTVLQITVANMTVPQHNSQGSTHKGTRTTIQMDKTFHRVNTYSYKNCFFSALGVCLNWRDNPDLVTSCMNRQIQGYNIKRSLGYTGDAKTSVTTGVEMQAAANKYRVSITVYNNLYQKTDPVYLPTIDGEVVAHNDTVHIMICNGHAEALIPRHLLMFHHPTIEIPPPLSMLESVGYVKFNHFKKTKFHGRDEIYKCDDGHYYYKGIRHRQISNIDDLVAPTGLIIMYDDDEGTTLIDKVKFQESTQNVNTKLGAIDLETCPDEANIESGKHYAYAAGYAFRVNDVEHVYRYAFGFKNCITSMFKMMFAMRRVLNDYTFYLHNGAGFDIYFLLNEYLFTHTKEWEIVEMLPVEGKVVSMSIQSVEPKTVKSKCVIHFRDSLKLAPCSLDDLCKALKPKTVKLTGSVVHSKIHSGNYHTFEGQVKPYLENDCVSLLECMTILCKGAHDECQLDLTKCTTGAAYAMKSFYYKYYKQNEMPLYTLPFNMDCFIRRAYCGGRTEAFFLGDTRPLGKGVSYGDINSMYPNEGCNDLPYGDPEWYYTDNSFESTDIDLSQFVQPDDKFGERLSPDFFGFVEVNVHHHNMPQGEIPFIGVKYDGKLMFPVIQRNNNTIVLFSEEVQYIYRMNLSYKLQFVKGMKFKRGPLLKAFFVEKYEERLKAKNAKNMGKAQMLKVAMNSVYGKFAFRTHDKNTFSLYKHKQPPFYGPYFKQELVNISFKGDYSIVRCLRNLDIPDINVGVGAAITAYGRMRIHELMTDVRTRGETVLYCDTDSVMSTMDYSAHPDMCDKYGYGKSALGCLKNEYMEKLEAHFKGNIPDSVKEQAAKEKYMFQRGVISMAKVYCLQTEFEGYPPMVVTAFKGLSKKIVNLDIAKFEQLLNGETLDFFGEDTSYTMVEEEYNDGTPALKKRRIYQHPKGQLQFTGGKKALMSEDFDDAAVRVSYAKKKFRMTYSKGYWKRGLKHQVVQPLKLSLNNFDYQ